LDWTILADIGGAVLSYLWLDISGDFTCFDSVLSLDTQTSGGNKGESVLLYNLDISSIFKYN
jgi:hypothetical protein